MSWLLVTKVQKLIVFLGRHNVFLRRHSLLIHKQLCNIIIIRCIIHCQTCTCLHTHVHVRITLFMCLQIYIKRCSDKLSGTKFSYVLYNFYTDACTNTHARMQACTHTRTSTHTHTHSRSRARGCMHKHTHTHTHNATHTHAPVVQVGSLPLTR